MQPVYESNGFVERFTLGEGELSFAVKDTLNVAGYRTQAGCPALAETTAAAQHAGVVETLLASGCRLTGKTTLHELAFGVTGINAWGGTPVNPLYPTLILAAPPAVRRRLSLPAKSTFHWAPIPVARCGCLLPAAVFSG